MTRSYLINCELFDGERVQQDRAVIIAGEVIEDIVSAADVPAEAIGLGSTQGLVRPGYRADLVQLDDDLNVVSSWIAGDRMEYR